MTDIIHVHATIEQDGEVRVSNLPVKRGQTVELSIRIEAEEGKTPGRTASDLLVSDLVGLWEDRSDIGDSAGYARQLREQAQHRER